MAVELNVIAEVTFWVIAVKFMASWRETMEILILFYDDLDHFESIFKGRDKFKHLFSFEIMPKELF